MFLFYITLKIYFLHSSSLLCCLSFKLYPLGLRMPLCTAWIKLNCIHWEFHNPSPSVLLSEMCGKLESERKWNLCIKISCYARHSIDTRSSLSVPDECTGHWQTISLLQKPISQQNSFSSKIWVLLWRINSYKGVKCALEFALFQFLASSRHMRDGCLSNMQIAL